MKTQKQIKFRDIENDDLFIEKKQNYPLNLRISVYVIIENNGKTLMIVDGRSKRWEFPGGGIEDHENLQEAAIREVLEETGYNIELTSKHPIYHSLDYIYNRKKDKFYKNFNFIFTGKLKNNVQEKQNLDFEDEIIEVKWFTKEEIQKLEIANFHKPIIPEIINKNP